VSALAYFLEDEGLPTVVLSLIRAHSEAIGNPRSLWVPFELGRPLGPPNNAVFQKDVMRVALELLEVPTGPVLLADYPHDDPTTAGRDDWRPPFDFAETIPDPSNSVQFAAALEDEIRTLAPFHRAFVAANQRTMVGLSGMDIEGCRQFFVSYLTDPAATNPIPSVPIAEAFRRVVDDLKAYYLEAMMSANPVIPSRPQLENLFWDRTALARACLAVRIRMFADNEKVTHFMGDRGLLPGPQRHRLGLYGTL